MDHGQEFNLTASENFEYILMLLHLQSFLEILDIFPQVEENKRINK